MEQRIPMLVEGFTHDIPLYMELSDFFIGKPGPGSISEALAKKLPILVERNAWTMVHERYNTEWIEELGAGIVVDSFSRDLAAAVGTLLAQENYARYRERAGAIRNAALYEIPEMRNGILGQLDASQPGYLYDFGRVPQQNYSQAGDSADERHCYICVTNLLQLGDRGLTNLQDVCWDRNS
jgi:1,2-diacylglycerol 3-beta-galactosyltransferase